jgi:hypothetical protein
MNKYNIEGGINFFDELYKSLDNETSDLDNDKCLITNETLKEFYVKLECGHKFNYIPLYNDLINYKKKFNYLECSSGKLSLKEIRCPFCRNKQNKLLPYHYELGLKKVNGINHYIYTVEQSNYCDKCQYQNKNLDFDNSKPVSESNKEFIKCNNSFSSKICIHNPNDTSEPITYNDNNFYCHKHKKIMIKNYKIEEKTKEKEKVKKEKEYAKKLKQEEAKKLKDDAKKLKQEEAKKLKESAKKSVKKIHEKNIVLGPSNIQLETLLQEGCIQNLKTGPNKGKQCCCKIHSDNLCLRHYKLVNNIIINN